MLVVYKEQPFLISFSVLNSHFLSLWHSYHSHKPCSICKPVSVERKHYSGDLDSAQFIMLHSDCVIMDHWEICVQLGNCIIMLAAGWKLNSQNSIFTKFLPEAEH